MPERTVTVSNRLGLHARAAAKLVALLNDFPAQATLGFRGREVNGKSIMGVMLLAAGLGSEVRIRAEGERADALLDAAEALFQRKFDEGE